MTIETQSHSTEHKPIPFGDRLKTTREARGLERKEAATHLRLNERIIVMMEKGKFSADLPVTFVRGYLRSYANFLQIPEYEIKKALEPIKPKPLLLDSAALSKAPVTSSSYFMQLFTYLLMATLVGLIAMWWYVHPAISLPSLAENQMTGAPDTLNSPPTSESAALAENSSSTLIPVVKSATPANHARAVVKENLASARQEDDTTEPENTETSSDNAD